MIHTAKRHLSCYSACIYTKSFYDTDILKEWSRELERFELIQREASLWFAIVLTE